MPVRKTTRSSWVELNWKPLLGRIDNSRLRRAKALMKQGAVGNLCCKDGRIEARVKNGVMTGAYEVVVPSVSWWEPYQRQVSQWLSQRPDWLASLLNGDWPEDFVELLESLHLRVFPNEQVADHMVREASCTCTDLDSPCRHILATIYYLIEELERSPLQALEQVGIRKEELLDFIHADSTREVQKEGQKIENEHGGPQAPKPKPLTVWHGQPSEIEQPSAVSKLQVLPLSLWPEENLTWFEETAKEPGYTPSWHRVAPDVDANRAQTAKEVYKAWK